MKKQYITKPCLGTKELSDKSRICKSCPYNFSCKITLRRRKNERKNI